MNVSGSSRSVSSCAVRYCFSGSGAGFVCLRESRNFRAFHGRVGSERSFRCCRCGLLFRVRIRTWLLSSEGVRSRSRLLEKWKQQKRSNNRRVSPPSPRAPAALRSLASSCELSAALAAVRRGRCRSALRGFGEPFALCRSKAELAQLCTV